MKKIILIVLSLIVCVGVLAGCSDKKTDMDKVKDSISYEQCSLSVGDSVKASVEIATGMRETNRLLDGAKGEMSEYATITILPKEVEMYDLAYSYKIVGSSGEISGECKRAVIGVAQTGDIIEIAKVGAISKVVVRAGEEEISVEMTDIMQDKIGADKAVESVYNECKADMESMMVEGRFNAEVLVKMTVDKSQEPYRYMWYVSVVSAEGKRVFALVDPASGELVAKKVKSE